MITSNVIHRTFLIKFGNSFGTAFTYDLDHKQYLLTAKHVVQSIKNGDTIQIKTNREWENNIVQIVGFGEDDTPNNDIIVLSLDHVKRPNHPVAPDHANLIWGQDVFFLGFPFGLFNSDKMNGDYPFPLIKKGIMSGRTYENAQNPLFLVDAINNPGFSGGPVVFRKTESLSNEFQFMGLVSGYRTFPQAIRDANNAEVPFYMPENTGITLVPAIDLAIKIIRKNPIGQPT